MTGVIAMKAPTAEPKLKFCGITRQEDASKAAALGACLMGFVFHPGSPRDLSPKDASVIHSQGVPRVGVFVGQDGREILPVMGEAALSYAQFHGAQTKEDAEIVGPERVIRVFWPETARDPDSFRRELEGWANHAAFFLFDAGSGGGGHGRGIPEKSLGLLGRSPKGYLLAGGLTPDNARGLWPGNDGKLLGFDFNSGVESSPGIKDHTLMERAAMLWRRA
jgi:phosphoribosylanthranilate isomerase